MHKKYVLIVLLFMGMGFSKNISDEEKIKNILIDMWDAIENEDIEKYAKHIHPDYTWFGETASEIAKGKENEINSIKAWLKSAKDIKTKMIKPEVVVNGNVAWITYIWADSGIENGKSFSSTGKSTRIFVKENGKWLCIHSHFTYL